MAPSSSLTMFHYHPGKVATILNPDKAVVPQTFHKSLSHRFLWPFLVPHLACGTGGTAGLHPHVMGTHREGLHQGLRAHKTNFKPQDHLSKQHSWGRNYLGETTLIQMVIPRADAARKGNSVPVPESFPHALWSVFLKSE